MKKAKRFLSLLLTFCMMVGMISTVFASGLPFRDVKVTDWYYSAVSYVYENGMMGGTGGDAFSPDAVTTRGMIVTVLHRLESTPAAEGTVFSDVAAGAYYANAVAWASENGIVGGYGNGKFGPDDSITREQLAAILYRYARYAGRDVSVGEDTNILSYTDFFDLSEWAIPAMQWACGAGLITGLGGGVLNPKGNATRAQAAAILMRFCEDAAPAAPDGPDITDSDDSCTVTFDSNGGSAVAPQTVKKGATAAVPAAPVKDGYMFAGWFTSRTPDDWADPFSFETPVERNLVLYALWVDVTTDADGDGLPDDLEDYIGTDSGTADSDGDGLSDYDEKILFDYDPTLADTDGDGVTDGDEDHDGDGLTNLWELEHGTDPILRDTDHDGLTDSEEVTTYHTDPLQWDTDGDGAGDGDEVRLGTDPLTAETAFVETADFGELTENRQVTVAVEATVGGEQVGTMKVEPVTYGDNPMISPVIPGYLGCAYDISVDGQPERAVLTFRYDTALGTLSEDFQPRVYYFNEETKTFDELPDQTVTEGQVRVPVPHFSTYILLNKIEFDKVWETEIKPPDEDAAAENAGLDVVFVIDYSYSMEENDPNQLCKQVSKKFVEKLRDDLDRAAVVKFIKTATLVSALTSDKDALAQAIDSIRYDNGYGANSGTDGSAGLHLALEQLASSESRYKYIVFVTDGEDNGYSYSYDNLIASAKSSGVTIYTVGMGSASSEVLRKVAGGTGGKYYRATATTDADDVMDLDEVFAEIESETIDYTTDSNNDGISDYYTALIKSGALPLSNGSMEFLGVDFNYNENGELSDDYDMDGVRNGEELKVMRSGSRVYLYKISDPMMACSDADRYSDGAEFEMGTDPMVNTYIHNAVDYPWDDGNFTYVDVFHEEDKWWNEGARELWSTVTFNWSHQDEAKSLLASFFHEYSCLDEIENTTESIALEVANLMGEDAIGQAVKLYQDGSLALEAFKSFRDAIKKWQAAGNSARNLSPEHIVQFKAQLGLFKYKYTFRGFSKMDKICMGVSFVLEEGNDIYNWIQAYSSITATQAAFRESQDVLEWIQDNDDAKEKFVTRAAEDLLLVVNEEYDKFAVEQGKDLALATAENVSSLALDILSNMNPYVLAVNLAIGLLDWLTPTTEIAENTYCLYTIDELVKANKQLFSYALKTGEYYDILDTETRYIELLICARIWGGAFAKNITGKQHYLGLCNDDEIRQAYAEAIDYQNAKLAGYLEIFSE